MPLPQFWEQLMINLDFSTIRIIHSITWLPGEFISIVDRVKVDILHKSCCKLFAWLSYSHSHLLVDFYVHCSFCSLLYVNIISQKDRKVGDDISWQCVTNEMSKNLRFGSFLFWFNICYIHTLCEFCIILRALKYRINCYHFIKLNTYIIH